MQPFTPPRSAGVAARLVGCALWAAGVHAEPYVVVDLGLGAAMAINEVDQVVVRRPTPGGGSGGYLWDDGRFTNLGSFREACEDLIPLDLNDLGRIVGRCDLAGSGEPIAFVWDGGSLSALEDRSAMLERSLATGINNAGLAVGWNRATGPDVNGILWDTDAKRPLAAEIDPSELDPYRAFDVNDTGEIAGELGVGAAIYEKATIGAPVTLRFLGRLPGADSAFLRAVNASGDGVGVSFFPLGPFDTESPALAMGYFGSGLNSLGTTAGFDSSYANDISDTRTVVGYLFDNDGGETRGFVWTPDFGMRDVNDLLVPGGVPPGSVVVNELRGVNSRGLAAGVGTIDGEVHALVLIPEAEFTVVTRPIPFGAAGALAMAFALVSIGTVRLTVAGARNMVCKRGHTAAARCQDAKALQRSSR